MPCVLSGVLLTAFYLPLAYELVHTVSGRATRKHGWRIKGVLVPAAEGVPAARQGASAERRGRAQVSAHQIPRECVVPHDARPCCRQTQQHP